MVKNVFFHLIISFFKDVILSSFKDIVLVFPTTESVKTFHLKAKVGELFM